MYTSSDALRAAVDELVILCKDMNKANAHALSLVAQMVVAVMANDGLAELDYNARTVTVPLDFLREGLTYEATLYRDAPDADGVSGLLPDGANPTQRYEIERTAVTAADSLTVRMAPSGGFALSLKAR